MGYGPKVLLAILVLLIGGRIIKGICKLMARALEARKIDATLRPFVVNTVSWLLKAVLFISAATMVGVETTSFVAMLGAAGLAIGLAFQGSLANLAGGVLLLVFRPYQVGDLIEAQGFLGVVKEVQIFCTIILTPNNKRVIIPNGALSNGPITNYTAEGQIRVDMTIGIAYESNIKTAKEILEKVLTEDSRVLRDPAPTVAVSELADSSVNLAVRPWCVPDHYWDVFFDTLENGKAALEAGGISIPFPQRDVHLYQKAS